MAKFLLLLHGDPSNWQKLSPDESQKIMEKYMAWSKKPFTLDGKRLADEPGKVIRPHNGHPRVSDGPYSETKEILGGFYLIEAPSYDEAVKLTLDHPQLEMGGTVEVRQLYGS
jgi:hypothetical protein